MRVDPFGKARRKTYNQKMWRIYLPIPLPLVLSVCVFAQGKAGICRAIGGNGRVYFFDPNGHLFEVVS